MPFFLVVVAGVVVVVFAALGGCTRPAEVFGVAPAPAPVKIKYLQCSGKYKSIYSSVASTYFE